MIAPARRLLPGGARGAALLVALWSIPGILAAVETSIFQMLEGRHPPFGRVLIQQCSGWWAWAAMTPLVFMLAERWPLRRPFRSATIAIHVAASLVATIVHGVVYSLASFALAPTPSPAGLSLLLFRSLVGWLPITVPIYFGLVAVAHWLMLARREREREQRTLALEAQLAERVIARRWTREPDALEAARRAKSVRFNFVGVKDSLSLAGGAVRLYPIDGIASEGALMAWSPSDRSLGASDYIQTTSEPALYTTEVARAARRVGISPLKVAAEHLKPTDWVTITQLAVRVP